MSNIGKGCCHALLARWQIRNAVVLNPGDISRCRNDGGA